MAAAACSSAFLQNYLLPQDTQETPYEDMDDSGSGCQVTHSSSDKIAQAVAALLSPIITATVDKAVSAGIIQLIKELGEHFNRR